jgi:hypothetical protein
VKISGGQREAPAAARRVEESTRDALTRLTVYRINGDPAGSGAALAAWGL